MLKGDKKESKVINYLTDAAFGFFFWPFGNFITHTSVLILKDPQSITDGMAILYIAMVTGLYYILSKKALVIVETKSINIIFVLVGFGIFIFVKNLMF